MDLKLKYLWLASIVFRILNACWQNGYIHPDEHFQSIEVLAGDVFEIQTLIPWEFNVTQPLRSITSAGLLVGLPLLLYKRLCLFLGLVVDFHLVLLLPRLGNAALSIVVDACLWRLCSRLKLSPKPALLLLWTSFILYAHLLRPLSNTWETFYFSGLLLLIHSDHCGLTTALLEGLVISFAFFCRPTFPLFAVVPLVLQLRRLLRSEGIVRALRFYTAVGASFVAASLTAVFCDSCYFGDSSLAMTPLNFLAYNWRAENLQTHGAHPWYTHFVANLPQLFGPACLLLLPLTICGRDANLVPLLLAFFLPTVCLSVFCHQEMRFLLPLLPIACLLASAALQSANRCFYRFFLATWLLFNALSLLLWGFVHQGGVVPALHHLREVRQLRPTRCQLAIFFRTYMPPEFLLARNRSDPECVLLHDLGSFPTERLREFVLNATIAHERHDPFLIFPSSAHAQVLPLGLPIRLPDCAMFPFHLTTEHPPDVGALLNRRLSEALYSITNAFSLIVCPLDAKLLPKF